jgi:hypothetical protein
LRKFILGIAVLALLIGGIVVYLTATTPKTSAGVRFPLTASQRELLSVVPQSAEAFALAPAAAVLHGKLLSNPVTREPVQQWSDSQRLPTPWMLGGADLVVWRNGKETSYAVRLDGLRAAFLRLYLIVAGGDRAVVRGNLLYVNAGETPPGSAALHWEALAASLPPGDALIVQLESSRGAFPPLARPAVTSVKVTATEIILVSHAAATGAPRQTLQARFAEGALLSATFAEPPAMVDDLNRLFGTRLSSLLAGGGSIILYDVDTGTLLPRPNGLIVVPADDEKREAVSRISTVVQSIGEIRDAGQQILISIDRSSMGKYGGERFVGGTWPATDWAARVDPKRLVPLLENLGDSTGLRLATPRLYRSIRDLRRWIRHLALADSIEAARSTVGQTDQMSVRITSK